MNSDPQRMWEVGRCITRGFTNHRGVARFWRDRLAVLVLMCVMGCGGSEPHRVPVEGRVTFRGQPIEKGSIVFIPTGDSKGPRAGTSIESGRYELEADRGPVIGTLRVEIRADRDFGYDITEPTETVQHIGEPLPKNEIPMQYNDESSLTVTTTESGDNTFDFHLPIR